MYAVTDSEGDSDEGDNSDEATGAESSSDEEEDADLSFPMMKQMKRQQVPVIKKKKWLLLLRVLDVLAVGEGVHRRRSRVEWMR